MKKLLTLIVLSFIGISLSAQTLYYSGKLYDDSTNLPIEMLLNLGQKTYLSQTDYSISVTGSYRYLSQAVNNRLPLHGTITYYAVPDFEGWHYVVKAELYTNNGLETFNITFPYGEWIMYDYYGHVNRIMDVELNRRR